MSLKVIFKDNMSSRGINYPLISSQGQTQGQFVLDNQNRKISIVRNNRKYY